MSTAHEHTADNPPERMEDRASQCEAITEHGTRCTTLTLHRLCYRHRRQHRRRVDEL